MNTTDFSCCVSIFGLCFLIWGVPMMIIRSVREDEMENKDMFNELYSRCIQSFGNSTGVLYPFQCVYDSGCDIQGKYNSNYCYDEGNFWTIGMILGIVAASIFATSITIFLCCCLDRDKRRQRTYLLEV